MASPPNGLRANGASVDLSTTVRDALSLLLSNGGRPLTVFDDRGDGDGDGDRHVAGVLTLDAVSALLDERGRA